MAKKDSQKLKYSRLAEDLRGMILEGKIQTVQNNLDDIREYYRISKLEQDNSALLLCIVSDLQKRVDLLEQKTA